VFEAPADLPEDPATLQAILRAALAEIDRLQFQLAGLQRNRFGRRSEKLAEETVQQATEDLEQSVAEKMAGLEAAAKAKTRPPASKPPKRNRGASPAHLPRSRSLSTSKTKLAPAAAVRCTRSAKTRLRCWIMSPLSSGFG
jgi:hypothetical protein